MLVTMRALDHGCSDVTLCLIVYGAIRNGERLLALPKCPSHQCLLSISVSGGCHLRHRLEDTYSVLTMVQLVQIFALSVKEGRSRMT
jgi:hypothetical protein